jgi:hypothetical protein
MINASLRSSRRASAVFAIATALAVTFASTPTFAASPTTGTVTIVDYSPGTNLLVIVGGVYHFAQLAPQAPCNAGATNNTQTMDTIKMWQALATSALLSGKTVKIYYNTCTPANGGSATNYIAAFDLNST